MAAIMITFLTAGLVLGLSAGVSPGPLLALVISQSLRHGAREGVKVALAPLITDIPIVLVSTLVLTRLAGVQFILGIITLAGGVFVAHLACESLRATGLDTDIQPGAPQSFGKGVLVNALSPHPYLFWLTVGAPLIIQGWAESLFAAAAFLAGFYGTLVLSKVAVAVSVGRSRHLFLGRPYVYVMRVLGILLAVFAVALIKSALAFLGVLG